MQFTGRQSALSTNSRQSTYTYHDSETVKGTLEARSIRSRRRNISTKAYTEH